MRREPSANQEEDSYPETNLTHMLILDFPDFGTVRNNVCCLHYLDYGISLQQPELIETVSVVSVPCENV